MAKTKTRTGGLRNVLRNARTITLDRDTVYEQWLVPKGTVIKTFEGQNFGWTIIPEGTLDKRGFVIPRRMFRE